MRLTSWILTAALSGALLLPSDLFAATVANWRHEEGPLGSIVPDGPDTVLDSSGSGNHMETFSSGVAPFTAATYVSEVSPLALRSGLSNTLSLDFGPQPVEGTEDGADPGNGNARNDDNFTFGKPIQTKVFTAMTVELSFNMHEVGPGLYQALVGKDGKPLGDAPGEDDSPVPPFKVLIRGDNFPDTVNNQLFIEWIDGDGTLNSDVHFLATRETIVPGTWYHVAFTLTPAEAQLWVAEDTGPYLLKDTRSGQDYTGAAGEVLVQDPTPWTIGRGMFGNGVTDWSNAIIDEVRISDVALTPDQFLFLPQSAADADFDDNGTVDARDFLIWQRNFGGPGNPGTGDADGNGQVNDADYAAWKAKFGGPPAVAAGAGVPEPAGAALAALAAVGVWRRRRCAPEAKTQAEATRCGEAERAEKGE